MAAIASAAPADESGAVVAMRVGFTSTASGADLKAFTAAFAARFPDRELNVARLGPRMGALEYLLPIRRHNLEAAIAFFAEHGATVATAGVFTPSLPTGDAFVHRRFVLLGTFAAANKAASLRRAATWRAACATWLVALEITAPHRLRGELRNATAALACLTTVADGALLFIEGLPALRPHNAFVRQLVLGSAYTVDSTAPPDASRFAAAGLNGTGQIIGLGDTGIDTTNPMFADPLVAVPFDATSSTHRKLVSYSTAAGDRIDGVVGHGTHVAGTLAGNPIGSGVSAAVLSAIQPYAGLAPGARIAFSDLQGAADITTAGEALFSPGFVLARYLAEADNVNALVSVSAFGSNGTTLYSAAVRDGDDWLVDQPYFLAIFSAGNNVDSDGVPVGTDQEVSAPCGLKNCLCVGATYSSAASWSVAEAAAVPTVLLPGGTPIFASAATFGTGVPQGGMAGPLALASPSDACAPLAPVPAGSVLLIQRGTCTFASKALAGRAAGAAAVIIANTDDGLLIMSGAAPTVGFPVVLVRATDARTIRIAGVGTTVTLQPGTPTAAAISTAAAQGTSSTIAAFSAHGPTLDGRFKPELYAPGARVTSALSGQAAAPGVAAPSVLSLADGTSIAAASVGAAAAIVQQYFSGGFYPTGVAGASPSITPTASLVKAVLINGAVPLTGRAPADGFGPPMRVLAPPSFDQGFGALSLADSIPVATVGSAPLAPYDIWMLDNFVVTAGTAISQCVVVTRPGRPLSATAAWSDPPLDASAGTPQQLINDFDMALSCSDGTIQYGNSQVSSSSQGIYAASDTVNNVERVRLDLVATGLTCAITVRGTFVPAAAQSVFMALVITGHFAKVAPAVCAGQALPTCGRACLLHGRCQSGLCICSDAYVGASCSQTAAPLAMSTATAAAVEPQGWVYYSVPVPQPPTPLVVEYKLVSGVGEIDVVLSGGAMPTLRAFSVADTGDNTPNVVALVNVPVQILPQNGNLIVGVVGRCCSRSDFLVAVRGIDDSPVLRNAAAAAAPVLAVLVAALLVAVLGVS